MRRAVLIAGLLALGGLVATPRVLEAQDRAACQRRCQREYDDCRDACPRSGPQAQSCQSGCQQKYDACQSGCR